MPEKVSDLTIDELKGIIREAIEEYFEPDGELRPEFVEELKSRISSAEWIEHDKVWNES